MAAPGLILAAPASGSGKTLVTLGLLRALRQRQVRLASFKNGPDYIDPAFHSAASGRPCLNLDLWAMRSTTIAATVTGLGVDSDLVLGEGAMGLFDAALDGKGSTADLAALTGWPVVLIVDVRGQSDSVAALLRGFLSHRGDIVVAGAILNRVGSAAHEERLRRAIAPLDLPVIGAVPREPSLAMPERHLGLVQASERTDLENFLDRAGELIAQSVDLDALCALAKVSSLAGPATIALAPLGQRIAIARDIAFSFAYPAVIEGWRRAGASVDFFSPLADEAPPADADAVYLPGGYPELHAGQLAAATRFGAGLRSAADRGAAIYGECGGYMVLGRGLIDADGARHEMLGLLPVETSFAQRRLALGYRRVDLLGSGPLGPAGASFRGHEFHYSVAAEERAGDAAFRASDSAGRSLGDVGRRRGAILGSYIHLIDRA